MYFDFLVKIPEDTGKITLGFFEESPKIQRFC